MNDSLEKILDRYYERFGREHDRLRSELLSSLPDAARSAEETKPRPTPSKKNRILRTFSKAAVLTAALVLLVGLGLWLWPRAVSAEAVFADVLKQIRLSQTVSYKSTLVLGNHPPRTSTVIFKAPGHELKAMPDGQLQISDWEIGKTLYVEPKKHWSLLIELTGPDKKNIEESGLERLKKVKEERGALIGKQELDGRPVSVFEVQDENDHMTIWADSQTALPCRVEIVTQPEQKTGPETTLILTDFIWNAELDDGPFELKVPKGYQHYEIRLIDRSQPVGEEDLIEALRILTDLSEGEFPKSLFAKDLMPILERLDYPPAVQMGGGMGYNLIAGAREPFRPGEPPPLVRWLLADQK
jgi:hypothetical protein